MQESKRMRNRQSDKNRDKRQREREGKWTSGPLEQDYPNFVD